MAAVATILKVADEHHKILYVPDPYQDVSQGAEGAEDDVDSDAATCVHNATFAPAVCAPAVCAFTSCCLMRARRHRADKVPIFEAMDASERKELWQDGYLKQPVVKRKVNLLWNKTRSKNLAPVLKITFAKALENKWPSQVCATDELPPPALVNWTGYDEYRLLHVRFVSPRRSRGLLHLR